jgi:hypothetical protein
MQRPVNKRFVAVGSVLLALAAAFFLFMLTIAGQSTDPVELMRTVGSVSGLVGGLAIAMIVMGRMGIGPKKA